MNHLGLLKPLAAFCLLSGSGVLTGCDESGNTASAQQKLTDVNVVKLSTAPLKMTSELPGRTSALRIAEVRPQVSGIIQKRLFTEGSDVNAGQALYQIDPAPYQAVLDSAAGNLAQAEASARIAVTTVNRYRTLTGTHYISQQDFDQAQATAQQAQAAVVAAKAAVKSARINLQYTTVTSPISGRIGRSSVTEGALVQNAQTRSLATVQQLDQMYVDVTQSGEEFLRLRQAMSDGEIKQTSGKAEVTVRLSDGSTYAPKGWLEFSDITVDETTGSITLRAVIPNPQHRLLPGMFVRARLDEGVNPAALLVPQVAVTRNPRGEATALVVGADNKVALKNITTGKTLGDQWQVLSGLSAGERVVVSGVQKIKPGEAVEPHEQPAKS
ncbi:efflux RND transporter periplasmic adaptor subunit [Rahnella inusitata]|uniref:efflux RND transporter periplasmic adaptor subunit n=1 Tax=Rahnella inusitata TaxID=58169 RepID=UPI0039AF1E57